MDVARAGAVHFVKWLREKNLVAVASFLIIFITQVYVLLNISEHSGEKPRGTCTNFQDIGENVRLSTCVSHLGKILDLREFLKEIPGLTGIQITLKQ